MEALVLLRALARVFDQRFDSPEIGNDDTVFTVNETVEDDFTLGQQPVVDMTINEEDVLNSEPNGWTKSLEKLPPCMDPDYNPQNSRAR